MLIGALVGPHCPYLRSPGNPSNRLLSPWPPHSPWLARWCGPLRLGTSSSLDCVLYWRRMVLVLAACPARLRWLRAVRRLEFLELPVQPTHLHLGQDGDCGQCIPGLDLVSTPHTKLGLSALLTLIPIASSTSFYSSSLASQPTSGGNLASALQPSDAISSYNITAVPQSICNNSRRHTLHHQLPARKRIRLRTLNIVQVQVRMRTLSRMQSVVR